MILSRHNYKNDMKCPKIGLKVGNCLTVEYFLFGSEPPRYFLEQWNLQFCRLQLFVTTKIDLKKYIYKLEKVNLFQNYKTRKMPIF